MQRRTFKAALGFALALAALTVPQLAAAQAWPSKQPIKFIAVFPPGGSVDQVARILAQAMSQQIGQSVIVENRGGASGAIGTAAVAQSAPDGYTLLLTSAALAVNAAWLPEQMPFDALTAFAPVSLIASATFAGVRPPARPHGVGAL